TQLKMNNEKLRVKNEELKTVSLFTLHSSFLILHYKSRVPWKSPVRQLVVRPHLMRILRLALPHQFNCIGGIARIAIEREGLNTVTVERPYRQLSIRVRKFLGFAKAVSVFYRNGCDLGESRGFSLCILGGAKDNKAAEIVQITPVYIFLWA